MDSVDPDATRSDAELKEYIAKFSELQDLLEVKLVEHHECIDAQTKRVARLTQILGDLEKDRI